MKFLVAAAVFLALISIADRTRAQAYTCVQDNDCLFGQYCDRVTTYSCQPCKDCRPYQRYSGYAPCVRNIISDCGSCMDGYKEVREYFTGDRVETCSASKASIIGADKSAIIATTTTMTTMLNCVIVLAINRLINF